MRYQFETNCVGSTYELINSMRDSAVGSSLDEMRDRCADFEQIVTGLGYDADFKIDDDWHVSYHRSMYGGRPCFYFVWSAYEYIFVPQIN